jgi:Ca-activated chloride channel family protein
MKHTIKKLLSKLFMILLSSAILVSAGAQEVQEIAISQIDTSDLLIGGSLTVYGSFIGPGGELITEIKKGELQLAETRSDNQEYPLEILGITENSGVNDGMNLLLLVDNSGSMYDEFSGINTRMVEAKKALQAFVGQFSPKDTIGLSVFNTFLRDIVPMGSTAIEINSAVLDIAEPNTEEAYTELYTSLSESLGKVRPFAGRKAVVVLSDGEDFSFTKRTGQPHPEWGDRIATYDQVIQEYQEAGVTVYAVNFADNADPFLSQVAVSTGGMVFEARDSQQLLRVYQTIKERIEKEVRMSVAVPADLTTQRNVIIRYQGGDEKAFYYAPLVLGEPSNYGWLFPLLAILVALGGFLYVLFKQWEKPVDAAQVFAIDQKLTVALEPGMTVIGSSPEAHMTIVDKPSVAEQHATIVQDAKSGIFTLVSEQPVKVNNKPTKKRVLAAGDVISIEGATIVFDEPKKK